MSLRNANIRGDFDATLSQWMVQTELIGSAVMRAIEELSGIRTSIKSLGSKRVDKSGRGTNVKLLVRVPAGANDGETFMNGSDTALALTHPLFKEILDGILAELSGAPSALLEIDFAQSQAVEVQAYGLVIEAPPDPPISELGFRLVVSPPGYDVYAVAPKSDMAIDEVAGINWSETPLIVELDGRQATYLYNFCYPRHASTDPLTGAWNFKATEVCSDGTTPVTYITTFDTAALSMSLTKDGLPVGVTGFVGAVNFATLITHTVALDLRFSTNRFLGLNNRISQQASGYKSLTLNEVPTDLIQIDSASRELRITNDTGAVIPANTVLGRLYVLKGMVEQIF